MISTGAGRRAGLCLALRAMATRFELVLPGEDEPRLRAAGEEALREIEACERALSLFDRASLVSHVHRCAWRDWVRLDADSFALFALCDEAHRASGGAFDAAVGARMRALGFHRVGGDPLDPAVEEEHATAPDARVRGERAPSRPEDPARWRDVVELDAARRAVRLARPDVRLDFGGIAKGHALDLAARALREAGIERAFLHGGTSSAVAIGAPPGEAGWTVALGASARAPRVALRDAAFALSGQHGRVLADGRGHVLDPRTGDSARGPALAAVVAPAAAFADAWSTALLVAGSLPARAGVTALVADGPPESPHWRAEPRARPAGRAPLAQASRHTLSALSPDLPRALR